jgi:hypothetical protein
MVAKRWGEKMYGERRRGLGFPLYTDEEIKIMRLTAEEIHEAIRKVAEWVDGEIEKAFQEAEMRGETER